MRRYPAALLFGLTLGTLAAAPPSAVGQVGLEPTPPEVTVHLHGAAVEGAYWVNGVDLTATLRDAHGVVKGSCTVRPADGWIAGVTPAPGVWGCFWGRGSGIFSVGSTVPPPTILPGDTVEVEQSGVTSSSGRLSRIRIGRVDPARDTIRGVVTPRRSFSYARVFPAGTGYAPPAVALFDAFGVIRRDGTFTLSLATGGGVDRRDALQVGYLKGVFRVVRETQVPGLYVGKDTNQLQLTGLPESRYRVELLRRDGSVKARAEVTLGGAFRGIAGVGASPFPLAAFRGIGGFIALTTPAGRPVSIRRGDRIRVRGWCGFAYRVPKLELGLSGRDLTVGTLPLHEVHLRESVRYPDASSGYDDILATTDATGQATWGLPTLTGPGDETVSAEITDRGNYVATTRLVLP